MFLKVSKLAFNKVSKENLLKWVKVSWKSDCEKYAWRLEGEEREFFGEKYVYLDNSDRPTYVNKKTWCILKTNEWYRILEIRWEDKLFWKIKVARVTIDNDDWNRAFIDKKLNLIQPIKWYIILWVDYPLIDKIWYDDKVKLDEIITLWLNINNKRLIPVIIWNEKDWKKVFIDENFKVYSYDSILSELSTSNQEDKKDKKEIYTNLSKLVAKIQNDYNKYYNEEVSDEELEEEWWYYEEYIFYPNIKIEITDWDDGVFLEINWEEINENPLKYIENLDIDLLAKYIIKYELKYLSQFEYERMSTSWKEILSRILKRDIMDSRNKKDIELLEFDYDRISSSWQKVLDIILKYVEYIKSNILEWTNATADTNSL